MVRTLLLVVLVAGTVLSIHSCTSSSSSSGTSSSSSGSSTLPFMMGKIEVIGNEPFTKLALRVDASHLYLLRASGGLEKELGAHQRGLVKLYYSGRQESGLDHYLVVDHMEIQENKK